MMAFPASLAIWFGCGILLGIAYFAAVWWTARGFARGHGAVRALAGIAARLLLLGGLLALAGRAGAPPLLAMAGGVLVGRAATLRRLGPAAS